MKGLIIAGVVSRLSEFQKTPGVLPSQQRLAFTCIWCEVVLLL